MPIQGQTTKKKITPAKPQIVQRKATGAVRVFNTRTGLTTSMARRSAETLIRNNPTQYRYA